jgi:transcription elongation factor Elf1
MEELEKRFKCPYCHARISMLLDASIDDVQSYIEDCEVCCQPNQLTFQIVENKITMFDVVAT